MGVAELIEVAKGLPVSDRVAIAASMLESLEEVGAVRSPEADEQDWAAEIRRRIEELRSGRVSGYSWEEVMRDAFGESAK